jgi:hypothetical protein
LLKLILPHLSPNITINSLEISKIDQGGVPYFHLVRMIKLYSLSQMPILVIKAKA